MQAKTRHRRQHVGGTCDHDPWSAGKLGGGSNLNPDLDLAQHLQAVLDLAFQDFLLLEHGFVAFENDVIFNQVRRGRMPDPIFCLLLHAPSQSGALLDWHTTNVVAGGAHNRGPKQANRTARTAFPAGLDDAALSSLRFFAAGASGSPYFICEVKARRSA